MSATSNEENKSEREKTSSSLLAFIFRLRCNFLRATASIRTPETAIRIREYWPCYVLLQVCDFHDGGAIFVYFLPKSEARKSYPEPHFFLQFKVDSVFRSGIISYAKPSTNRYACSFLEWNGFWRDCYVTDLYGRASIYYRIRKVNVSSNYLITNELLIRISLEQERCSRAFL